LKQVFLLPLVSGWTHICAFLAFACWQTTCDQYYLTLFRHIFDPLYGHPQTFFQGRPRKFSKGGGQGPTFCLKTTKKDAIFFSKKSKNILPPFRKKSPIAGKNYLLTYKAFLRKININ
jgi:hypothetical protein